MKGIWSTFVSSPRTLGADLGVRERWRRGRQTYAVWAFRLDEPAVLDRMATVRQALGARIAPVPAPHVTMWVAGFPSRQPAMDDDIAWSVLDDQRRALKGVVPGCVHVGGANAFLTCAMLEVQDAGWVEEVRQRLASAGRPEIRFAPYHPHVTVGRFPNSISTAPIARTLGPLRDLEPLKVHITAIELLTFDASTWDSPLETTWKVEL